MTYQVYILHSIKFDRFYIGKTSDFADRLNRHNLGREKSTKPYLPWEVIYLSPAITSSEAHQLEIKLKNLKSRKRILEFIEKQHGVAGPEKQ